MTQAEQQKIDKRALHLAEKYELSLQLTTAWARANPEKIRRPMRPDALKELKTFARY